MNLQVLGQDVLYKELKDLKENLYEEDYEDFENYTPTESNTFTQIAEEKIHDLDKEFFTDEVSTKISGQIKANLEIQESMKEDTLKEVEDLDKLYFAK